MKIVLRLKRQRSRIGFAAAQTSASWNQTENIKVSPGSADNSLESVQMHAPSSRCSQETSDT